MDYIKNGDQSFRRKIDGCLVGFADMIDKYRKHISETEEGKRKTPEEFLSSDFLLEMMIKDYGCYENAISVMKVYSEETLD